MRATPWTDVRLWAAIDKHAQCSASFLAIAATDPGLIRERLVRYATSHALAFAKLRDVALDESARRWRERAA